MRELSNASIFAAEVEQAILNPGQELAVITELERLSERFAIDQTINISINEVKENELLPTPQLAALGITEYYTISLLNQGTFENHIAYLHAIESLPYYIVIDGVQWQRRNTSEKETTADVTLRLDGYIFMTGTNQ